ncbi:hypothetical protein F7725_012748 [Dissostichus mawsoni]|uniref:Uncharacterized protein n=1 Tax=Dissostichus mawsoni TaxID=36200 RepID=A0A7J5YN80_DISMA|nr:hypothetical protein F7725_012748 [Dissostichus mawsoni]
MAQRCSSEGSVGEGRGEDMADFSTSSLFPMPCVCPCATITLSPCPGASGQEGRPDPSKGGHPDPHPPIWTILSTPLWACPTPDSTTKAAAAKETRACLIIVMKPFLRLPTRSIMKLFKT